MGMSYVEVSDYIKFSAMESQIVFNNVYYDLILILSFQIENQRYRFTRIFSKMTSGAAVQSWNMYINIFQAAAHCAKHTHRLWKAEFLFSIGGL